MLVSELIIRKSIGSKRENHCKINMDTSGQYYIRFELQDTSGLSDCLPIFVKPKSKLLKLGRKT